MTLRTEDRNERLIVMERDENTAKDRKQDYEDVENFYWLPFKLCQRK